MKANPNMPWMHTKNHFNKLKKEKKCEAGTMAFFLIKRSKCD